MALDVDKVLQHIGQFGPYQIRILVLFLFMIFPITYQTLIMVFIAFEPPWMCVEGSSSCQGANFTNGSSVHVFSTATKPKSLYERRCFLNRTEWKFADYDLYDGPHLTIVNQVNSEFIRFSLIIILPVSIVWNCFTDPSPIVWISYFWSFISTSWLCNDDSEVDLFTCLLQK